MTKFAYNDGVAAAVSAGEGWLGIHGYVAPLPDCRPPHGWARLGYGTVGELLQYTVIKYTAFTHIIIIIMITHGGGGDGMNFAARK